MTISASLHGTTREMDSLFEDFNVRRFVRIDVDRYLVTIRVQEGFSLGKTRTIKGAIKKLAAANAFRGE